MKFLNKPPSFRSSLKTLDSNIDRSRESNPFSMDRLSGLPEAILCHILSFLPTKTTAATSVLSKRWQHLWTSVAVLDFNVVRDTSLKKQQCESFVRLAYELISLPRKLPIKIFRLSYLSPINPLLRDWIAAAEELHLGGMPYLLFDGSSAFMNLQVLKLSDCVDLDFAESGLFPKLRVLHLIIVSFEEAEGGSLENLLAACPVLEELLWQKDRDDDGKIKICVPTLTSLVVITDLETVERDTYDCVLALETPALEYLSFSCHCYEERLEAANLCKLRRADIDCYVLKEKRYDASYGSCVIDLLSMLSSVEFLKLSCDPVGIGNETGLSYVHGLVHGFDYSCLDKLPVFHNLVRLEICIPSCDCALLPHLLQKFHNLQHIAITKKLDAEVAEACWIEPLEVPICLSSSLLSFSFKGFEGFEVEMKLVEYVLKHAMVLKNVTVDTSPYVKAVMARVGAMQRLPMGLRGSKACQVHLTT